MAHEDSEQTLRRYVLVAMAIVIMLAISLSGRSTAQPSIGSRTTGTVSGSRPEVPPVVTCTWPASSLACGVALPSQAR